MTLLDKLLGVEVRGSSKPRESVCSVWGKQRNLEFYCWDEERRGVQQVKREMKTSKWVRHEEHLDVFGGMMQMLRHSQLQDWYEWEVIYYVDCNVIHKRPWPIFSRICHLHIHFMWVDCLCVYVCVCAHAQGHSKLGIGYLVHFQWPTAG